MIPLEQVDASLQPGSKDQG